MWLSECVINLLEVPYSLNIAVSFINRANFAFSKNIFQGSKCKSNKMINYVISYREILLGVLVYKNLSKL